MGSWLDKIAHLLWKVTANIVYLLHATCIKSLSLGSSRFTSISRWGMRSWAEWWSACLGMWSPRRRWTSKRWPREPWWVLRFHAPRKSRYDSYKNMKYLMYNSPFFSIVSRPITFVPSSYISAVQWLIHVPTCTWIGHDVGIVDVLLGCHPSRYSYFENSLSFLEGSWREKVDVWGSEVSSHYKGFHRTRRGHHSGQWVWRYVRNGHLLKFKTFFMSLSSCHGDTIWITVNFFSDVVYVHVLW